MATYATPPDVATRLNVEFDAGETAQCEALLEDVSVLMRARLPLLDQWIADGLTETGLAKSKACYLAMQAITVIDAGVGSEQTSHPEYFVRISTAAQAGVRLSDDDVNDLTPSSLRTQRGKAFSIRPGSD